MSTSTQSCPSRRPLGHPSARRQFREPSRRWVETQPPCPTAQGWRHARTRARPERSGSDQPSVANRCMLSERALIEHVCGRSRQPSEASTGHPARISDRLQSHVASAISTGVGAALMGLVGLSLSSASAVRRAETAPGECCFNERFTVRIFDSSSSRERSLAAGHRLAAAHVTATDKVELRAVAEQRDNAFDLDGGLHLRLPGEFSLPQRLKLEHEVPPARSVAEPNRDGPPRGTRFSEQDSSRWPPHQAGDRPGWQKDPWSTARASRRWWDGQSWTARTDP